MTDISNADGSPRRPGLPSLAAGGAPMRSRSKPNPASPPMPSLFDPIRLGDLDLPNRILMAPMTRMRADPVSRVAKA